MSTHSTARDGAVNAQQSRAPQDSAEIREIYPGSSGPVPRRARRLRELLGAETGMATAEYAIATLAAVGFAGILVFIMRSDEVRGFLLNLIRTALALP
ncbi:MULTISPECIES: DUF4244 domain-containing protein [unclassified Arthrobacter]|uniref:DUF4244 domain-containing protein n=1 Tax=unclassified Arthrobacter TaxID=235627 RepID=UPI002E0557A6|nr:MULTISPECIES: DUF4244 domain-containing protein [unclassified Arthrobacter]MEC5189841.1 hypothetical protein [Arthrobacter sp. MP_M4]MEC5201308.1 hypothetical protein [Arthrobacter sp. MP_M7]